MCILSTVSHVNTGLYVIQGEPNLRVLAHGDKYYIVGWIFRGELLAVPQAQGGPCSLCLCVCVCMLYTQQLVCVMNDLRSRQMHTVISVCANILMRRDPE